MLGKLSNLEQEEGHTPLFSNKPPIFFFFFNITPRVSGGRNMAVPIGYEVGAVRSAVTRKCYGLGLDKSPIIPFKLFPPCRPNCGGALML